MLCLRHESKLRSRHAQESSLLYYKLCSGPSLLLSPKLADLDRRQSELLLTCIHSRCLKYLGGLQITALIY